MKTKDAVALTAAKALLPFDIGRIKSSGDGKAADDQYCGGDDESIHGFQIVPEFERALDKLLTLASLFACNHRREIGGRLQRRLAQFTKLLI